MTQAFEKAFAFTHKQENGSEDAWVLSTLKGEHSETFAGIYRLKQPQWSGWELIDQGDTGSDELKRRHKTFFYSRFWVRPNLEQLPFPLSALVYDFSTNSGDTRAVIELQQILLTKADGKIGANTAGMARAFDGPRLCMRYISARLDYVNGLAGWKINSGGWSQRIADILKFAAQ